MPFIAQVAPSPPIIPMPRIMPPRIMLPSPIIPIPPIIPPCSTMSWRSAAARSGSGTRFAGSFGGVSDNGSRIGGVVSEINELVGEVVVEVVGNSVGLARCSGHIEDEIGPHRRAEHDATSLGRMRVTGLAVMGDDDRLVSLEPQSNDARERGIDD